MKKRIFITLLISMHLLFIIALIHKHSWFVRLTFEQQRLEKQKQDLAHQKNQLENRLHALHNRASIKKYAQDVLHMKKISLNQIKQLPTHE